MTTGIALARSWERRVLRAAHPLAFPFVAAIPAPVRRVPGVGVVVKDPALLRAVLMNSSAFSKAGPGASSELWTPVLGPSVLVNMEGEEHIALRRKLGPLFAPAFVEGLVADGLGPALRGMSEALSRGESVDLVALSRGSASQIISRIVGIDSEVVGDELFHRVATVTGFVSLARPRLTDRQLAIARGILSELGEHASRAYHGDESTVPGRMRALGLDEREALGAVGALVLTGTETIVSAVPRIAAILIDSGWLPRIAVEPTHLDAAIAEGLRVTTPSPVMVRATIAPDRIGTLTVAPGDRIILGTYWANGSLGEFDPEANPAATLKQLWFGAGAHYCIGAPLAMAQLRGVLGTLLAHPSLQVVERRLSRGVLIPSYSRLMLREGP